MDSINPIKSTNVLITGGCGFIGDISRARHFLKFEPTVGINEGLRRHGIGLRKEALPSNLLLSQ